MMFVFQNIRFRVKKKFDRINNDKFKINLLQAIPFWVASVITGLMAVGYAKSFAWVENEAGFVYFHWKWLIFIISPITFVIAWWLVKKYAPYSRGSGIPQVMAAIELATPKHNNKINQLLGLRIIFIKIFSSLVLVFGGGVIGREGPTIQIAGSVFRKINLWLPDWWPKISKRNMIMTGAAAGLAAAFNTPLGGIVFAIEELTKTHISYFKTAIFSALIIAGLTAQALAGPYLYLGYPDVRNLSAYIFFPVIIVSIIGGLMGSTLGKSILSLMNWRASFKHTYQTILFLCGCSLVIGAIAFFIDMRVLNSGKELMTQTLFGSNKHIDWYVPVLRFIGPLLCFSTGAAGGVFAPTLSAGASLGSVVAGWMHLSATNTNLLVLSGMVACLTGVTRSPFTCAILVLEMTDRHNVIFHLMLAGMLASLISSLIDKHSLYDHLKDQYLDELRKDDIEKETEPLLVTPQMVE